MVVDNKLLNLTNKISLNKCNSCFIDPSREQIIDQTSSNTVVEYNESKNVSLSEKLRLLIVQFKVSHNFSNR